MADQVLHLMYSSSLTNLCEINSSFDTGVLKVCYTGQNRNGSYISRDAIERSIRTMYNCPVVCNYDRETDSLGGHDIEIVRSDDGSMRIVNVTQPVGVIPESARYWFENITEDDGTVHEYLCTEVLVWKRQEAYQKIKDDGVTRHSMEITVKSGRLVDDVYHIDDFEFTAFTLISVEPCFEGSALEMFSKQDFKAQMEQMMNEFKESYSLISASNRADDIDNQSKGGNKVEEKMNLLAERSISADELDFSIDELTIEELAAKLDTMQTNSVGPENSNTENGEESRENEDDQNFELNSNVVDEVIRSLRGIETIQREWGEYPRYCYADCDTEAMIVYCWDCTDWLLYGFKYSMNGDAVFIDIESRKRMKYEIAEFVDGDANSDSPFAEVFDLMAGKISSNADFEVNYQSATAQIAEMSTELDELRNYKAASEADKHKSACEAVMSQFPDLCGIDAFEALRENFAEISTEDLEEKCFAIRGRNGTANFSLEQRTPKLKVGKDDSPAEPYGGIFVKYGIESK